MKRFFRRLSSKKKESDLHRSPVKASWPSAPSNSLPATDSSTGPTFLELQHNIIPATGQQEHETTKTDSFNTWHTHATTELDKQVNPPPFRHTQSMTYGDAPALQLICSREGIVSGSPFEINLDTKLAKCSSPLDFTPKNGTKSPQHQLASIYRSYNNSDILSSGSFDFDQHQLLASAPDADWQDRVSDRLPDRPNTVTELPQKLFSHHWEPQSTSFLTTQGQPNSQPNTIIGHKSHNPALFSSPDESARFKTVSYNGPSPMTAGQGLGGCPASQHMTMTPFAKYASIATSGPLLSADLNTAMPVTGRLPVQPHQEESHSVQTSGKQHKLFLPAGSHAIQQDGTCSIIVHTQ